MIRKALGTQDYNSKAEWVEEIGQSPFETLGMTNVQRWILSAGLRKLALRSLLLAATYGINKC